MVVTTSNPSLVPPANARAVELPAFEPATGAAFLLARASRSEATAALRVAEWAGGLPAALALAAAWVQISGRSFDDYLRALNDPAATSNRLGRLDVSPPVTPVEAAVLCGLRAADAARPGAAAILADLAAGSAVSLPVDVIAAVEPGDGGDDGHDRRPLAELLAAHGLVVAADGWAVVPPPSARPSPT